MLQTLKSGPAPRVPWLIKRNTLLIALSQSFTGAGMSMGYGLGPLMVIALTGSSALAGLSVALFGFQPVPRRLSGRQDHRRPWPQARHPARPHAGDGGRARALALHVERQASRSSWRNLTVFGMGMSAAQQMRVPATDMFPPSMRAQALGYVALGSLVGLMVMPVLVNGGEMLAQRGGRRSARPAVAAAAGADPAGHGDHRVGPPRSEGHRHKPRGLFPGPCAGTPVARDAGRSLQRARPAARRAHAACHRGQLCGAGQHGDRDGADLAGAGHHGHSLTAIAVSPHAPPMGMFAFTVPLGKLADRYGREPLMYPGVATTLVGALLVTYGGLLFDHPRDVPGRARLGGRQCGGDRPGGRSL